LAFQMKQQQQQSCPQAGESKVTGSLISDRLWFPPQSSALGCRPICIDKDRFIALSKRCPTCIALGSATPFFTRWSQEQGPSAAQFLTR